MKIKIYIVTYKNENYLKNNIDSLLSSDITNYEFSINVINNFNSHFGLSDYCRDRQINIISNQGRPDFSTGHLSRNWNQAILHGFKSLSSPDCDLLVLCQNDNLFKKKWTSYVVDQHRRYDFITIGGGDQFHSYRPNHVKTVGMWDERFCNIGYQEADYFIRSYLYNKDRSSINDYNHKRIHNSLESDTRIITPSGFYGVDEIINLDDNLKGGMRGDEYHIESLKHHDISKNILDKKWGIEFECNWSEEKLQKLPIRSKIDNYIFYPYFEKEITDLSKKGYIV
jgi:hypothetical protein